MTENLFGKNLLEVWFDSLSHVQIDSGFMSYTGTSL